LTEPDPCTLDLDTPRVTVLAVSPRKRATITTDDAATEAARAYCHLLATHELVSVSLSVVEHTGPARLARHIDRISRSCEVLLVTGMPAPLFAETDRLRSRPFHGALINETSLVAVSIVASVLQVLDRIAVSVDRARIAVVDSPRCPDVSDILTALGTAELTLLGPRDFVRRQYLWPIPVDVTIDLTDPDSSALRPENTGATYPASAFDACRHFAAPLLSALCGHRVSDLTPDILVAATHAARAGSDPADIDRYRQLLAHAIGHAVRRDAPDK
jgi:hypothetical protein